MSNDKSNKAPKKLIKKTDETNNKDIIFQITEWDQTHEVNDGADNDIGVYTIRLYGTTKENKKIYVCVQQYTPYFYIEIPLNWKPQHIKIFIEDIKKRVPTDFRDTLKSHDEQSKCKFYGFTDYTKFKFIRLIFNNYDGMKAYERVFNRRIFNPLLGPKAIKFNVYESNIIPFLRCMHIRNLQSVGWVKIEAGNYKVFSAEDNPSNNEISIYAKWTCLKPVTNDAMAQLIVASFDIECTSSDGGFPQPERDDDKIIQIGTTFNIYGQQECYYKHIITLGSCDPIPGVDIESYNTEQKVLLAWTKLIQRINPDIMTGYNIFGFDYQYLAARAKKLGCLKEFSKLSRLKDIESPFIKKELSSAALGDNKMTFFDINGRVNIDLMKVVQRDYKLPSYKLDSVAGEFIRDKISKAIIDKESNTTTIMTRSTYGMDIGRYVKIFFNDGLSDNSYKNDAKFEVLDLKKDSLTIKGILDGEALEYDKYTIFWCQTKDDIELAEIFGSINGTSADRAKVARYCIQDCVLINKLMEKLYILTNNIGMANVCSVPLSFIFLRGQGVKIFSLVSKKCREREHVMPVIRKKWISKEDEATKLAEIKDYEKLYKLISKKLEITDIVADAVTDMIIAKAKTKVLGDDIEMFKETKKVLETESHTALMKMKAAAEYFKKLCGLVGDQIGIQGKIASTVTKKIIENVDENIIDNMERFKKAYEIFNKMNITALMKMKDDAESSNIEDGYDGAIVLDPIQGVHYEPVPVLDYASLYPRSMIHRNISHECLVTDKKYDNLEDYIYQNVTYLNNDGTTRTCRYAKKKDGSYGIIPEILNDLLEARLLMKDKMEHESDPFLKKILDGLQLAYKLTANSLYGQTGAKTSPIYLKDIAASTTATGREMLLSAKKFAIDVFPKIVDPILKSDWETYNKMVYELFDHSTCGNITMFEGCKAQEHMFVNKKKGHTNRDDFIKWYYNEMKTVLNGLCITPECIYGDTDSIFINFHIEDIKTKERLTDHRGLSTAIKLGILCGDLINVILPAPHNLEYEKTFWPFIILSKKRYVGNMYEFDPNKYAQKSMGIVLKRRDNSAVVKVLVGGIVKTLMNERSSEKAIQFTKDKLRDILSGKFPIEKFVITKTLKGPAMTKKEQLIEATKSKEDRVYANRSSIVHAVLADRMAERDPGNKPQSNDRIPYAYIQVEGDVELQGDRVEHPDYIIENKLQLDYLFYITNQIMKPAIQFLEHVVQDPVKLFNSVINRETNRRKGVRPMSYYCKKERDDNPSGITIGDDDIVVPPKNNQILKAKAQVAKVPAAKVPAAKVPAAKVPAAKLPAAKVPAAKVPAAKVPAAKVPAAKVLKTKSFNDSAQGFKI